MAHAFSSNSYRLPLFVLLFLVFVLPRVTHSFKPTSGDDVLDNFTKWLEKHGGKCRCHYVMTNRADGTRRIVIMADRRIENREAIFMVPQSILINSTVIDSSPLGPSLDMVSLVEDRMSRETDSVRQAVMHVAQLTLFVLYGLETNDDAWLPYFNQLMNDERCNVLWMWEDKELEELQDSAMMKRAQKWKQEVHMLAVNIVPKLLETGSFSDSLSVDNLKKAMCIVQSRSFNVTSSNNQPVRTLVPGLDLFTHEPSAPGTWWAKGGALRYRYVSQTIEHGDTININLSHKGDSTQTLFEYGVFVSEGSKYFMALPQLNSRSRRKLVEKLKIKKKLKYADRFTFKSAGLPYFRVQSLSDSDIEILGEEIDKNQDQLLAIKAVIKSPSLHTISHKYFSCKDEVVALNIMSVHLRDELSGMDSSMAEDEAILTKANISTRLEIAVSYRLRFKKVVTNALDVTSARAVQTKRKCLSRDEL